jgi:light-regulated signal transduction histidine kinase (bacteriophytochrome)
MRHSKPQNQSKLFAKKHKTFNPDLSRKKSIITLVRKNEELMKANEDLTAFTYVSSHDLQEPLRKIRVFSSILIREEDKKLSREGKDFLQRIQDTAKRMQELLDALTSYSRTRDLDRVYEHVSLKLMVEQAKKELVPTIIEKHAVIHADNLCDANIIPYQFRILFRNLLSNSLKFSSADRPPRIVIKTETNIGSSFDQPKLAHDRKYCHISVTDNGIGFDPQYKERIFKVFTRLNSAEEYEGTGIGLAICRRIVENHHGIITANGTVNEGAQFDIYIPTM